MPPRLPLTWFKTAAHAKALQAGGDGSAQIVQCPRNKRRTRRRREHHARKGPASALGETLPGRARGCMLSASTIALKDRDHLRRDSQGGALEPVEKIEERTSPAFHSGRLGHVPSDGEAAQFLEAAQYALMVLEAAQ
jgi:hypothetical protein